MITASRPLHTGRLVLTPSDPEQVVATKSVADLLRSIGFIGAALAGRPNAFATGEHFLQLLAFTGCAVQFDRTPTAPEGTFAHVKLDCGHAAPRLLRGRNTRPPRCPSCGKALATWRGQVEHWQLDQPPILHCPHCTKSAPGWRWNWRQHGGFGRSFILVEEVFPGEGAPLPALLRSLHCLRIGDWHSFYVQD
ncbi:MAG: hypothetical protein WBM40_10340 [Thiohalocapsa sp.]